MSEGNPVHVAVGLLMQSDQQVLLTSRPVDKPWAYWWELPGGKIEAGESPQQALARELQEELNILIDPAHSSHWRTTHYHYPSGTVKLEFFLVRQWSGRLTPLEGQQLAWVTPTKLADIGPILPATLPILRWLRLPATYLISSAFELGTESWLNRLAGTLQAQPGMVQFREPQWQQAARSCVQTKTALQDCWTRTLALCRRHAVPCLINSVHPQAWWTKADGVHLRSRDAHALSALPSRPYAVQAHFGLSAHHLLGVSTHHQQELQLAARLQADFAVLGPVLPTASHPGEPTLGWTQFEQLCQQVELPVYALGGQSPDHLATARTHQAHGIAGISRLLLSSTQGSHDHSRTP